MRDLIFNFEDSPISNLLHIHDLINIQVIEKNDDHRRSPNYKRLDPPASASFTRLLQLLPSILTGTNEGEIYRLFFPEGIASALIALKSGMFSPVLPGYPDVMSMLSSAENIGTVYNVFSTLSVITNQYYLHQINQQLREIQSKLDQVLDFLYDEKECEIYSETTAVIAISRNYSSIMSCPEQRTASLQTVQHAKIVAERNIQFYYRSMNKKAKDAGSAIMKLREDLQYYTQVISLYGLCSTLEIVLSQNYDKGYLDYIEMDLQKHVEDHIASVNYLKATLDGKLESKLKPASAFPFVAPPKPDLNAKMLITDVEAILGDDSPITDLGNIIKQIRKTFTSKTEYIIESNGVVYQKELES